MDRYRQRYGEWAMIAGAAEGIGAGFSIALARQGMNLIMTDNNRDAMEKLAGEIRKDYRVDIVQVAVDLAQEEASSVCLLAIANLDCRLLIYVAAYSKVKPFLLNGKEDLDRYLQVNNRTPVHLIHGFAARLNKANTSGGILLISSLAGLMGPPLVAPYAATKAFLVRLAESLSHEFKPMQIDVTVCCAGLTDSPTFRANTPEQTRNKVNPMDPVKVADFAIRRLGKRTVCIPGWKNRFNYFILTSILPKQVALKIVSAVMQKMYR